MSINIIKNIIFKAQKLKRIRYLINLKLSLIWKNLKEILNWRTLKKNLKEPKELPKTINTLNKDLNKKDFGLLDKILTKLEEVPNHKQ